MRVLALDTTRPTGSVALVEDGRVGAARETDPSRSQAERLPGDLVRLLDEAGVRLSTIDLFAVGSGPGSFTGLRVGIATMQGLAFVERKQIVAVSALEALAHAASTEMQPGDLIGSWMDGYRRDVFSALYEIRHGAPYTQARLAGIDPPSVGDPSEILSRWVDRFRRPAVIAGDGAVRYRDRIGNAIDVVDPPCLAATIGLVAAARGYAGESVNPGAVQVLYVRRPDAEIAREQKQKTAEPPYDAGSLRR